MKTTTITKTTFQTVSGEEWEVLEDANYIRLVQGGKLQIALTKAEAKDLGKHLVEIAK